MIYLFACPLSPFLFLSFFPFNLHVIAFHSLKSILSPSLIFTRLICLLLYTTTGVPKADLEALLAPPYLTSVTSVGSGSGDDGYEHSPTGDQNQNQNNYSNSSNIHNASFLSMSSGSFNSLAQLQQLHIQNDRAPLGAGSPATAALLAQVSLILRFKGLSISLYRILVISVIIEWCIGKLLSSYLLLPYPITSLA